MGALDLTNKDYKEALQRIDHCKQEKALTLNLSGLAIDTIPTEIQQLTQLQTLDVSGTSVRDLSPLAPLTQLQTLDVSYTSLSDLSPLASLTQLQTLHLSDTSLSDLNPLASLTQLQTLHLSDTSLSDLSPLASLTRLQTLEVSHTSLSDLSPLASLTQLQTLHLSNTQVSDLSPLASLTRLQTLEVSHTSVRDLNPLASLTRLQTLEVSHTSLSDLSPLAFLTQLQTLHLSNTQVSDLSPLASLTRLQTLEVSHTSLSDLSPLAFLTQLQRLYLYNTQVSDLNPLASLTRLEMLSLSETLVHDLAPLIPLTQLQGLYLYSAPLSDLRSLNRLTQLHTLNISETQVSDLSPLTSLTQLQTLHLSDTAVSDLSPLASLTRLQTLDVYNNKISNFPAFLLQLNLPIKEQEDYSGGIFVGKNPWKHPPLEILLKGPDSIRAYFESLENKTTRPLNEVKVILVGEGAAGKTSLVRRLLGQAFNPHESQTHGIMIQQTKFNCAGEQVQVHFWDFGGQEIMHATHQFFLTERSVYVLVLDSRKEDKAEYWLKHIDAFGRQSPVLVVINKIDENPGFDLNRPFLNEKYPSIGNRFFRVSCQRGDGIAEFQDCLQTVVGNMDIRKQPFSPDWLAVKQTLTSTKQDFISYTQFQNLCEEKAVTDETQQKTLLGFLNDLGIVFEHKRQSDKFDTFIMNPHWLTQAVYRVINAPEVADNNGFLTWNDLPTILHKPEADAPDPALRQKELKASYPKHKFGFIVSMLQQFELGYESEKDERWMIPDLLPVSRKHIPIDFTGAAHYLFVYDFLPNSVLPTLMVQLSRWIVPDLQWRTGVVLKDLSSESYAYIEADKEAKTIAIRVKSDGANFQRSFLNLIRQTLQDINKKLNISIEEKVALPDMPNEYVAYQDLIGLQAMGAKEILIPKLRVRYSIVELLEGVDSPTKRTDGIHREKIDTVAVFISYSHKDPTYKEELVTFLNPLIRQEKIQLWQDGEIDPGQRWNDEIMGHLEQAHIVITLMSPDFIKSEFCYSIELANAQKAAARGEKTIIPVQIRPCKWQKLPIGAIQGIPTKPISSYRNHDTGWDAVYEGIEKVLDSWQQRHDTRVL